EGVGSVPALPAASSAALSSRVDGGGGWARGGAASTIGGSTGGTGAVAPSFNSSVAALTAPSHVSESRLRCPSVGATKTSSMCQREPAGVTTTDAAPGGSWSTGGASAHG